jgi:putative exporter of polyketide antibiotics
MLALPSLASRLAQVTAIVLQLRRLRVITAQVLALLLEARDRFDFRYLTCSLIRFTFDKLREKIGD